MFEINIQRILQLAGLTEARDEDYDHHAEHSRKLDQTGFWGAQGAGCIFFAKNSGRFLIAHRSNYVLEPGTWGTWGGAIDKGENPREAAMREVEEEAGYTDHFDLIPIFVFVKGTFRYSNFIAVVEDEFQPKMDWETQGFKWCAFGQWPKPMHFGLKSVLDDPKSVEVMKRLVAQAAEASKK